MIFKTFIYTLILALTSFNSFNLKVYGNFPEKLSDKVNNISIDYFKNLPQNDYILGPGDSLFIMVSRAYPELNTTITVDREGTINIPRLKKVYVQGLTTNELVKLLDEAFLEYIKFPETEVKILSYRPIRVYVDGEVANPGLQTLSGAFTIGSNNLQEGEAYLSDPGDLSYYADDEFRNQLQGEAMGVITNYFPTVYDAIRSAGGISRFSDLKEVEVIRDNSISKGGGRKKAILNFERLILEGDNTQNIRIYDGDFINIKKAKDSNLMLLSKAARSNLNPKFINVYVSGRVQEAGNKKVAKTSTLNDVIAISGGTKVIKGKITFIRFNVDGTVEQRKISYSKNHKRGAYKNPFLEDGDIVFVGQSFLSSSTEVISEVTAPFQGLFSAYGLLQVITE